MLLDEVMGCVNQKEEGGGRWGVGELVGRRLVVVAENPTPQTKLL